MASNLLAKWAVGEAGYSPVEYMIWEYGGIVLGGVGFVYGRHLNLRVGKVCWFWGIIQGLLFGWGALWYVGILVEHPLSLASIIRRVAIVICMVVLGLWGFGERRTLSTRQKWLLFGGMGLFGVVVAANG